MHCTKSKQCYCIPYLVLYVHNKLTHSYLEQMTFTRLGRESQDIKNTLCLQIAQFYARPARPTLATTVKVDEAILPIHTSPSSRQVHYEVQYSGNAEG